MALLPAAVLLAAASPSPPATTGSGPKAPPRRTRPRNGSSPSVPCPSNSAPTGRPIIAATTPATWMTIRRIPILRVAASGTPHIGWMLREYQRDTYHDYSNVRDLVKQPRGRLPAQALSRPGPGRQHRHSAAVRPLHGIARHDVAGRVLRMVMTHHTTFFINSLAHIWGSQPFTDRNSARDNGILAFFTFGEGLSQLPSPVRERLPQTAFSGGSSIPTKWLIRHRRLVRARQTRDPARRNASSRPGWRCNSKRAQARVHQQDDRGTLAGTAAGGVRQSEPADPALLCQPQVTAGAA